jgi:hypothetical protein
MTYRLSSGRRYLNGELIDPPQLGPWVEEDLFPCLEYDDLETAGLSELAIDEDDWDAVEDWLQSLDEANAPIYFLIERCCDDGGLLPEDMLATRLKDFPRPWIATCRNAIDAAPAIVAGELLYIIAWAVRIERARRYAEAKPEEDPPSRIKSPCALL